MAVFTAIAAAITSAFFAVAGAMGATLATAGLALAGTIVGYVGAAVIYGGVALALSSVAGKIGKRGGSYGDSSATYGNPVLQTQTNQELPIPLLYGTVKLGGNRIWQDDDVNKNIKRIVGFAEGEITDFTDIRLNDIKQADIKGISVNKYLGTSSQQVDSIVGGKNNAERVEKVGSLKNVAYLAINVPKGEKIDANYNLTTVVKGRKIRVYTTPTKYTVKYSENPAWVMFDFLTSYNGLGLCLNNDGTINNGLISQLPSMTKAQKTAINKYPFENKGHLNVELHDYKKNVKHYFCIPRGYCWDGATIPRLFWRLIGSKTDSKFLIPSMVHDVLCEHHEYVNNDRYFCDKVFERLLYVSGVPAFNRWLMFHSVDNFQKFCGWGKGKEWNT